ncbi:MAG: hypothetical protein IT233_11925 [Bacteroidia bacterium]|nr:hypothetical protein [Bacteroidia bacterium]
MNCFCTNQLSRKSSQLSSKYDQLWLTGIQQIRRVEIRKVREAFTTTAKMFYDPSMNLLKIIITEGAHLEIDDIRNHFLVSERLTEGRKALVLFDARATYSITAEARDEAAALSGKSRIATAIVTSNPLSRFIASLYIRISRPLVPTKIFEREDVAQKWLELHR